MKTIKILSVITLALSLILSSCTSIPSEKEVEANNISITGYISDYIKVENQKYKFKQNGDMATIALKLTLTSRPKNESICHTYEDVKLLPLDEVGGQLPTGRGEFKIPDTDLKKIKEMLNNGNIGDTKTVTFSWGHYNKYKDDLAAIFNETASFEIIDDNFLEKEEAEEETSTTYQSQAAGNNNTASKGTTSTKNDWDQILDEYDNFVDKYISLLKKSSSGDMSAMTEYLEYMEKAQDLADQLSEAEDDMTSAQMARYMKIMTKMANAASDL